MTRVLQLKGLRVTKTKNCFMLSVASLVSNLIFLQVKVSKS